MKSLRSLPAALLAAAELLGCAKEPPTPAFEVHFEIKTERGLGLPDAKVLLRERELGTTDERGGLEIKLPGDSQEALVVSVVCPAGYVVPAPLLPLRLARVRDLRDASRFRPVSYAATCERTTRDAVIVVEAKGAPDVPVTIQGKAVGRTNADGIGHFFVSAPPGTEFDVVLDTTSAPRLRPQNPSKSLVIGRSDEVVLFAPEFSEVVPKRVVRRLSPQPPSRPTAVR